MQKATVTAGWCCSGLAKAFSERNEGALFVYSEKPDGVVSFGPSFWVAARGVQPQEHNKPGKTDNDSSVVRRRQIFFCPWCGESLGRFYPSYPNALTDEVLEREIRRMING